MNKRRTGQVDLEDRRERSKAGLGRQALVSVGRSWQRGDEEERLGISGSELGVLRTGVGGLKCGLGQLPDFGF